VEVTLPLGGEGVMEEVAVDRGGGVGGGGRRLPVCGRALSTSTSITSIELPTICEEEIERQKL